MATMMPIFARDLSRLQSTKGQESKSRDSWAHGMNSAVLILITNDHAQKLDMYRKYGLLVYHTD